MDRYYRTGPARVKLHAFLLWWGNPEQDFLNTLLREDLERAIAALPDGFRVVVILADLEGFSYQEIPEPVPATLLARVHSMMRQFGH